MRHGKFPQGRARNKGFSIFEMVAAICSIVILYMVAEQRLNDLPAAAERANFYAVLEQIKTGITFEMVNRLARGQTGQIRNLEGTNPMNMLLETPSNYRGELTEVTDAVDTRNSWYFETSTGELVYVVGGASIPDVRVTIGGTAVNLGQIRLKITNAYSGAEGSEADWQGLLLMPVREYAWERRSELPVPLNQQ